MNIIRSPFNKIKILGLLLVIGVNMTTFAATMAWKEEVLLHEGTKLIIERLFNLGGYPELSSRERKAVDETVSFNLLGSDRNIVWKTDFRNDIEELNGLNLLILDVVNGIPYIATYPAGCIAYNKWKRPNPPYIFFKYDGNVWKRISLEEFPEELNQTNVIVGKPPAEFLKPFYTVEDVKQQNHGLQKQYLTISRTKINNAGDGCPELIRIKGGWASSDGPKAPIPVMPEIGRDDNK